MVIQMSKHALVVNNVAVNVITGDPAEFFPPPMAEQLELVPDEVDIGWQRDQDTGVWSAPPSKEPDPEDSAPGYPSVSPVEFKLLFTPQERVAINKMRATDDMIDDFFTLLDDQRLTQVNLALASVQGALQYLVVNGKITEARRLEILSGQVQ
jgi:hypothetical protein